MKPHAAKRKTANNVRPAFPTHHRHHHHHHRKVVVVVVVVVAVGGEGWWSRGRRWYTWSVVGG